MTYASDSAAEDLLWGSGDGGETLGGDVFNSALQYLTSYIRHTEFKRLFNQILTAQEQGGFRSLAVLSEFPGEGRSFFVSGLALAYARYLPSRVLIVDSVNQTVGKCLYLESVLGVHEPELVGGRSLAEPGRIDLVSTRTNGSGSYDSSDFQIGRYVEAMRDRYDVIIVDTCSLNSVGQHYIDPVIIAHQVDATILVTSLRSYERPILQRIKQKLKRYGIVPLGTVFNSGARN